MSKVRQYEDLRKLQKAANQRMVRLEKLGISSPSYEAVQAKLEIMGRQSKRAAGRRFTESGKVTYNEYQYQMKVLREFMGAKTSTQSGAKRWINDIYETSNEKYDLAERGISREDWAEFWKNAPNKGADRVLGSERVIKMVRTYMAKRGSGKMKDEQQMSFRELAEEIYSSKNVKEAHEKLGITYKDVKKFGGWTAATEEELLIFG